MQISELFSKFDELHEIHGSSNLTSIYGAGEINNPNLCLVFMNPTAKNVASTSSWSGIKAPWLGTKNVWRLLYKLGLFKNKEILNQIESMKPSDWTKQFAESLYAEISNESIYITNIAKCTQDDARHLSDSVYREYLPLMLEELEQIKPKIIFTFGNQVSSILMGKSISVSQYSKGEHETLVLPNKYQLKVFPCFYPVGQGTRNITKAIERIKTVLDVV